MENVLEKDNRTTNLLPIVPLRGKVAFPHTNISFEVGRDITLKAIDRSSATDRLVLILTQRVTEKDEITAEDVYTVGCVAKIKQVAQLTGGAIRVLCEGLYRAKARSVNFDTDGGYYYAVCDPIATIHGVLHPVCVAMDEAMGVRATIVPTDVPTDIDVKQAAMNIPAGRKASGTIFSVSATVASTAPIAFVEAANAPARTNIHIISIMFTSVAPRE